MHGYRNSYGGDLNENDNLKGRKLIIHGYKKCMGDLNENGSYKKRSEDI